MSERMDNKEYDVIIIGAGHNGLVCAGYLAKAGLKVIVFEQWPRVGGCTQTEELIPNFRISPASIDHILIQATPILKELELESRFGLEYLKIDPIFSVPFPDGKYFLIYEDLEKTCKSIADNISQKEADNYRKFVQFWMKGFELMIPLFFVPLYPLKSALFNLSHIERKELFRFVIKKGAIFSDIVKAITMSPKLLLDGWFETEYVKAPFAWTACNFGLPPSQSGMGWMTSFPILGHYAGCKRPKGGSGMLPLALARMIKHYGGTIKVESRVKKVVVENGKAKGVILENGDIVAAKKAVISAMSPKTLFLEMIDKEAMSSDFRKRMENLQADQATGFKLDLALSELPKFTRCGENPEITIGSPMICPSIEYLERAYDEKKNGEPPKDPCFWASVPTAVDPTLAPEGKHILYLFGIAPKILSGGRRWEDIKEQYAEVMIDKMEEYVPNIREIIIGRHIETPDDLKKRIGDFNGVHIDYYLDQSLMFRPIRELAGYKTPIKGLYVSASGTHPGAGVGGIPGRNTAKIVLEDINGKGFCRDIAKSISIIYEIISVLLSGKSK